tara:strand:+ start:404 stop:877 length:474 start_codon:yes stop_codon:yes gene_type:complete
MAYASLDDLLSAALAQLGREQGDPSLVAHSMFHNGTHLEGTDDKEPHNMNPVLFEDEYGRKIRGSMSTEDAYRPGLHDPEAIKRGDILDDSNMIEYTTEDAIQDEVSNALFNELFRVARGKSVFSNDALDKQKGIRDYLDNDDKVRKFLIKQGKIKA